MFGSWRAKIRKAERDLADGRLSEAAWEIRREQLSQFGPGRKLIRRLVDQLIARANRTSALGDFQQGWEDLTCASKIALVADNDRLAREKTRLVDLTIEHADQLLRAGKPAHASRTLSLLKAQRILDRRADQIDRVCASIQLADQLAAEGRMRSAQDEIRGAQSQRPELAFLNAKLQSYEHQQNELKELTGKLRRALTNSHWSTAQQLTGRMLQIAPHYQLAIDALRRCNSGRADSQPVVQQQQLQPTTTPVSHPTKVDVHRRPTINFPALPSGDHQGNSFLMWVDGVGGYLVCTGLITTLGQAVPRAQVDIPIQGDIRRRHLKFQQVDDAHILVPLADVEIDGSPVNEPAILKDGQEIVLGGGVKLCYRKPHPFSSTACLRYASPHRTRPWSDGILLMGNSLVLGPGSQCHIRCPDWKRELVIFRDGERLYCNNPSELEIDGDPYDGGGPLAPTSRIVGEDFSITLEPT